MGFVESDDCEKEQESGGFLTTKFICLDSSGLGSLLIAGDCAWEAA